MSSAPYAIELYLGEKRSGKTLSMVHDTYKLMQENKGFKIKTNLELNKKYFPEYEYITREELVTFYQNELEIDRTIFLIDEMHLWFDCREHGTKENKMLSYMLGQLGKRGNVLRGTTHFFNFLELRLRLYCEKRIYCYKGIVEDNEFKELRNYNAEIENKRMIIKNDAWIYKLIGYEFMYLQDYIKFIKADKIFNMYNTKEIIKK